MDINRTLKKYWLVIVVVIVVVLFLYPKECGHWSVLDEKNCKCYGILNANIPSGPSEGWSYSCYGICIPDCTCKEGIGTNRTVVPCG